MGTTALIVWTCFTGALVATVLTWAWIVDKPYRQCKRARLAREMRETERVRGNLEAEW